MKNYFTEIKRIDYKFLILLGVVILSPFIYSWIRIFWIVENGTIELSMTHFQTYLQMFMEILSAFLLIPLFTYSKDENNEFGLNIFTMILVLVLIFSLLSIPLSEILINPMIDLNPTTSIKQIRIFLYFQSFTVAFMILEQYLLSEILVKQKKIMALIFALISIILKITIDILLLSKYSIVNTSIESISISSFISTFIICLILSIAFLYENKNDISKRIFNIKISKQYFKRGLTPGIELLIRNVAYSLVILQAILMLGENDWNAWNMGGYIYWVIIFKFTSIFDYYLLSESVNKQTNNMTFKLILLIELVIILLLGIILSETYLVKLSENESWSKLAIKLSLANIPIMLLIATQNVIKIKIITENKYWYMLASTLINLILLHIPLIIIIYFTSIDISFWWNYMIFGISCLIPTTIAIFQYKHLNKINV